jgi:large subunit ribosomal protein L6
MSRIGSLPITITPDVTVTIISNKVEVKGSKGSLSLALPKGISVTVKDSVINVSRKGQDKPTKSKHGLVRSLIFNMILGVSQGYSKQLEVEGVGFKVRLDKDLLILSLGFSHDIEYKIPASIDLTTEGNIITVSGIDKQLVGQTAAEIRALRKPEPYKGKGIKYAGEHILRKTGKSTVATE